MTADLHSMPVALLQREIKNIAARINRSASLDELDRALASLSRLQDALALATERAKSLADCASDVQAWGEGSELASCRQHR